MNELKKYLELKGYKTYNATHTDNLCKWYACKQAKTKRECECNDAPPQIVVTPSWLKFDVGHEYESVEVEIRAEYKHIWWKLGMYGLSSDEIQKRLPSIEKSLIKAWENL